MALLTRLAGPADAEAIAAIYRPYVEGSRITFEEEAPDAAEIRRRLEGEVPGYHPWFVAEEGRDLLGFATSAPFRTRRSYRWTVETGLYLVPEAQRRGIGRALLLRLLAMLEAQGYVAAVGAIALPNDASVTLHEKLGFEHSGTYRRVGFKMGHWLDVGLWQKELAQRREMPREPLPVADVRDDS